MSKLLHIKGSKIRVLNTFPANNFGNEGDIVISRIKGKGVYLCSKAANIWYVTNRLQELRKVEKSTIRELSVGTMTISKTVNSQKDTDKFLVSDAGRVKYRTGEQVVDDLSIPVSKIDYKKAYCSLEQYKDKESCEANKGTWYYSDNDSHDSVSSTAENQLLTVSSIIGKLDSEPTLLYDGSTLEIKRNTDFDDNWQTSAIDRLLKLSYDSSNNTIFKVDSSGSLTFDSSGSFTFEPIVNSAVGVTIDHNIDQTTTFTSYGLKVDTDMTGDLSAGQFGNYIAMDIDINTETATFGGVGTLYGFDIDIVAGTSGVQSAYGGTINVSGGDSHVGMSLTVGAGDLGATSAKGLVTSVADGGYDIQLKSSANGADFFNILVGAEGATTLSTTDADTVVGHLTLQPDGDLILDPVSQKTIINATDGLYFDGGTHTYIVEDADDRLEFFVGTDKMLILDEASDAITLASTNWIAGTVSGDTVTEFSAVNSAYAGMILGMTIIGTDVADASYNLTTSFAVMAGALVTFKTPPSENVEIQIEVYYECGSGGKAIRTSISNNASYGSNTLGHSAQFEKTTIAAGDRGDAGVMQQSFYLASGNLAAIGSANTIYIAAETDNVTGTPKLRWGGDATLEYPNFVIRAIALPATVYDGT
jgi:hypothetical protein